MGALDRMKQAAQKERSAPQSASEPKQESSSAFERMKQAAAAESVRTAAAQIGTDIGVTPTPTSTFRNPLALGGRNPAVSTEQFSTVPDVAQQEQTYKPVSRAIEESNARIRYNRAKQAVEADKHNTNGIYSNNFAEREAETERRAQNEARLADAETALSRLGMETPTFDTGKLVAGAVRRGVTSAAGLMGDTAQLVESALFALPEALTGYDDLQELHGLFYKWNQAIKGEQEAVRQKYDKNVELGGTGAKVADTVISGTVAALPQAVTAYLASGVELGVLGAQGLEKAAQLATQSQTVRNTLQNVAQQFANDPNFWSSLFTVIGSNYEEAKADGADDAQATLYAVTNGILNAAIEVGGGIETLPEESQTLRNWLKSAHEEGVEEIHQGIVERGLKRLYGKDVPIFSTTDEAAFNPASIAEEYALGTAIGGILGGGQMAVNAFAESLNKAPEQSKPSDRQFYTDQEMLRDILREAAMQQTPATPIVTQETGITTDAPAAPVQVEDIAAQFEAATAEGEANYPSTNETEAVNETPVPPAPVMEQPMPTPTMEPDVEAVLRATAEEAVTRQEQAEAQRKEPPAGNLTPAATVPTEAQKTGNADDAALLDTLREAAVQPAEKPKGGVYRGEKTGLPFDVVVEQIPTQPTTSKMSEPPLQERPTQGTMEAGERLEQQHAQEGGQNYGERRGLNGADQTVNLGTQEENGGRPGVPGAVRENERRSGSVLSPEQRRQKEVKRSAEYKTEIKTEDAATWTRDYPAYTDSDGNVHMRGDIDDSQYDEVLEHELNHVMHQRRYQPYLDFLKKAGKIIDVSSDAGNILLAKAAEHRELDLSHPLNDDSKEAKTTKEILFDEVAALVRGAEMSGHVEDILGDLREAFTDYDAFAKELDEIHRRYVSEQSGGTAKKVEQTGDTSPQQQIADAVRRSLDKGIAFNSARLFEIADKAFGGSMAEGKYTVKDAYDGMELAVNQYLMNDRAIRESANGDVFAAQRTLSRLQDFLSKLPTQTKRSAEQESYQQFSTPPNIAYLAAWAANVNRNDVVLEPSAGIGGLALWPKAWGATVYGNELSKRRLAFLDKLGLDGTFNLNAEQINNLLPDEIKPTVVLMNPPFSATAGRTATNNTANAKRHIEQALDRLEDGGRLVAILGNGMNNDAKAFRSWWNELREDYSIRANIRIDGENYKKYGTDYDIQLVVIDKTGPQMGNTITGEFKDLSTIPGLLEGVRNDRTRMESAARAEQDAVVAGVQEAPERPVAERPVPPASVEAGAGAESAGLEQSRQSTSTDVLADDAGSAGNAGLESARNGVSPVDNKRGAARGNERRASAGRNAEVGRSTLDASRPDNGQSGGERLELERNRADKGLSRAAAKEAAEHPDSIYTVYVPRKAHVKGSVPHPAKLVESAAMAAVEPPDATYTPNLPENIVTSGALSDAQLENVIYAGQAHAQTLPSGQRKGFFIGDGTGVGKGRQIAGIILDNYRQGRDKAVWISEKKSLIKDAIRDWTGLGGDKKDVIDLGKIKYKKGKTIDADSGILFSTYDTLKTDKDARIRLLKDWLGDDFDGVIALDEAHNMGNANGKRGSRGQTKPSAKALAGIDLQNAFPNARVVYASATGATNPSEYAYLQRLGLWGRGTAFNDFNDFMSKISNGGLAAMELVARDMKAMGEYMARSISYDDVTYDVLTHNLTPMQTEIYNTMSKAWQKVMQNVNKALEITGQQKDGMARGRAMSAIFGTQQRFYNQILTSMSMPSVIEDMRKELANGRSCVLQLVNTNAAAAERAIAKNTEEGGDLDDLDLTPSDMLIEMVQKSFPVELYEEYTDEDGRTRSRPVLDGEGKPVIDKKAVKMRDALIDDLKMMKVPDGPLEMLFDAFGEENVAEVTGRTRRVVEKLDETGNRKRVIENRSENSGIADADMFQDGKKRILVFSDAGGTGRSYHADLTAKNQQQRVHYLLQPGWEASKAVQGFGRTHRSNQASAPIFRLITTNVMGQKRFTSTIARRLDQLGALTKGQRQAGSGVFGEKDNLENPIAEDALSRYYRTVSPETLKKLGLYEKIYDDFGRFNDKSETLRDIGKFLNRILSLEVDEQNKVFQGFYETFERFMDTAIANGTVDMGLENYRADKIDVVDEKVVRKDPTGADTKYVQMTAYRKPKLVPYSKLKSAHPNFQGLVRTKDGSVRAVYEISSKTNEKTGEIQRRFRLDSPVEGKNSTYLEETLNAQTKSIDKAEWKTAWEEETAKAPEYDESTLHLLTGTLLPIWDRLPQDNTRVMRVMSSDGRQYLGRVIRPDQIDSVLGSLGANRTRKQYTGSEVQANVMQGKEAAFERDRLKLIRRRVSGEWRMELTGPNVWFLPRQYSGIITEKINFQPRFFIPTGENGNKVLDEIMKHNPVADIRDAAPETDVEEMRGSSNEDMWRGKPKQSGTQTGAKGVGEILEQIRHDFDVNITAGHVRGAKRLGLYNRSNRGIRVKHSNDLPIATHELGHHLDNVYGLRDGMTAEIANELVNGLTDEQRDTYKKKSQQITEGIAEYFRKYLQDRDTAAVDFPEFTAYFKQHIRGNDLAQIDKLADEINAYYVSIAESAAEFIRDRSEKAPDARTWREKLKDTNDEWYQRYVDSNHSVKLMTDELGDDTAYKLATNAAYRDAVAASNILYDLRDINGKYVSGGLKAALSGVNLKNKSEYKAFNEYLVVRHAPERLAEGMTVFNDPIRNKTEWMNNRQAELEAQYPKFEAAADRLYDFIGDLYQTWGVNTGLISQDMLDQWRERWAYYVPFNRVVPKGRRGRGTKRSFANQDSTVRRAHGSTKEIINPVDNLIDNLVRLVNAGVLNNVMQEITKVAEQGGADAAWMERVPVPLRKIFFDAAGYKDTIADALIDSNMSAEDKAIALDTLGGIDTMLEQFGKGKAKGDVVTVLKNGNQEFWKVNDPLLLQSLSNLTPTQLPKVLEAYGNITRFMTAAITGNDVIWGLFSNFPRDLQTLMYYTGERNKLKLLAAMGESYVNKFKLASGIGTVDPVYMEYVAMGGGGAMSAYTSDRNLADNSIRRLSGDKTLYINPLEWLAFISDTIEGGPRFATYKACRARGFTPQAAIYAAHDITVNFRRAGTESRQINKFIPYFNAGVQGLDKYARWLGAEDVPLNERKSAAKRRLFVYLATSAVLGALMYAINNRDDEAKKDYQLLSNYTKNSYYNFPLGDGRYFAIPKARELSVPTSLFETLAERYFGGNEHAFDEFWSYSTDNFLPPVVGDIASMPEAGIEKGGYGAISSFGALGVVGSLAANRDYLGKPIVSAGMQYYEPRDQYNERTSKLAKALGEGLNYSPQKIDYALQQTLGGFWKYQKALFPVGSENVDLTLGVQNRYVKDNQYSTDLVNRMYDRAAASDAAKKSDPMNNRKAVAAAMDSRIKDFYSNYYSVAKNNTELQRGTRQEVLNILLEYEKESEHGYQADDPASANNYIHTPTHAAICEISVREGDTALLPSTMNVKIKDGNGTEHLLSDVEYVEYQTDYLRRYYEYIEDTLPKAKSEKQEAAIIRAAKNYAKDGAQDRVLKRIGAPAGDALSKYGKVSTSNVILFKSLLDLADDDGSLKQDEVIAAIDRLSLSRTESSTLFHTKYTSDKNNPYK